ncbi:MAG: hypothetical protein GY696_15535, partial [Gammaproteobacteria bacterium]|nr:hypothetical protein [Gammaproteobacteria bacterium]
MSSSTPPLLPSPGDMVDIDVWAAFQRNLITRKVQNVQRQLALRNRPADENAANAPTLAQLFSQENRNQIIFGNLGEEGVRRYMSLPAHDNYDVT